jgi:hypothetical protein
MISLSPKEEAVLQLIEEDTAYKNYFFNKVSDLKWFLPLKEKGYFAPQNAPGPQPADEEGYYSIPWWNVLTYLEKVSEQVDLPENEKYIDELLQIIREVSTYTDATGKHIDNYHIWRIFVIFLNNIPREKIPIDVIKLIPIWLDSKFDTSLVGSEIGLKLLPKFLAGEPSDEDITKAERIVDYITKVKPVKLPAERAKLYNKEEEYKLIIDSYWIKEIFDKYAGDIGEKCTNSVIDNLCRRILPLLIKEDRFVSLEVDDKSYLLSLSFRDKQYTVKVFDTAEKNKSEVEKAVMYQKAIEAPVIKEVVVENAKWQSFINHVLDELTSIDKFGSVNPDDLKRQINNLYANFHDQGTYSSFYDESRSSLSDPLDALTYVLKSILLSRAIRRIDETKAILRQFFNHNYFYFPKMALYIIGQNMDKYEDEFWRAVLDSNLNCFFYEGLYFGDELRHVMEKLSPLSEEHREQLKKMIENGPRRILGEDDEEYIKKWKQERYCALTKDTYFKKECESFKEQTGADYVLRPAVGAITVRWGEGPPPLTKDDILSMSNEKLAAYLKEFRTKHPWEGPTVGGLARLIKECATEKPDKFIDNLSPFMDSYFIYIYEILGGIKDACNNKQIISWGKVFDFIHDYIDDRDVFWKDQLIAEQKDFLGGASHFWIIGTVMDLIQQATKDDSLAYGENQYEKVEKIIFLILSKLEPEEEKDIKDYVTHALNSPHGKTIIALIHHALHVARVKGLKEEIKWSSEIKSKYDALLKKNITESYALLGRYLPNLFYLDKEWTTGQVKGLYPKTADKYWEAFMDGYLSIGTVYHDLYGLMMPHYKFAISHNFREKRDNEHLVQHIALGYLIGFEDKDLGDEESLIRQVLDNGSNEQLLHLISFLWFQQRYLSDDSEENKKIINNIISLWKWIYEDKYKDKPEAEITDDDKKILSALARLTVYLNCINEESAKWIMIAAPYANENYNSSFFIEALDKFEDMESLGYIGKIFLKMLDHFIPDFDQKHICSIVEKLYKNNYKKYADNICIIYGMKGYEFLRDLHEKYSA